jgi:hypothetical protein
MQGDSGSRGGGAELLGRPVQWVSYPGGDKKGAAVGPASRAGVSPFRAQEGMGSAAGMYRS